MSLGGRKSNKNYFSEGSNSEKGSDAQPSLMNTMNI